MKRLILLIVLILGLTCTDRAQVSVALLPIPKPQFFGANGAPLAGCKIFTYITGTSTPLGTYFDSAGLIPNSNPVTCDAGGFVSIWLIVGNTYRILVQDQNGVQQYLVDGVVGVGGGTLSLFSTPNTWTALQTFSGGINASGGGTLSGTFTGSPAFSGTPGFTTFTVSNSTVIANLNSSLWNGTSVNAGGALTTGFVPVVSAGGAATWNNLQSIAGVATLSQLPGAGVTTVDGVACTIGSTCSHLPFVVYNTPAAATNASIGYTTVYTPAANGTFRFSFILQVSALGTSCTSNTTVQVNLQWTDPLAASSFVGGNQGAISLTNSVANQNGILGPAFSSGFLFGTRQEFRAKGGTAIQYQTTYVLGTGCSPGPSYIFTPIIEQLTAN